MALKKGTYPGVTVNIQGLGTLATFNVVVSGSYVYINFTEAASAVLNQGNFDANTLGKTISFTLPNNAGSLTQQLPTTSGGAGLNSIASAGSFLVPKPLTKNF